MKEISIEEALDNLAEDINKIKNPKDKLLYFAGVLKGANLILDYEDDDVPADKHSMKFNLRQHQLAIFTKKVTENGL